MTTNRIDETYREATRKLIAYLASDIEGFLTQAIERLESVGVRCDKISRDKAGAKHLLQHILH